MNERQPKSEHTWNSAEKVGFVAFLAGALVGDPTVVLAGGALLIGGHLTH